MDSTTLLTSIIPLVFSVIGFFIFLKAFKQLSEKRLIEDIPTSTVRGLAMGLVEVCGKAKSKVTIKSPLTNTDCVFYKYIIEEFEKKNNSGHWIPRQAGDSSLIPFYLEDHTGGILILPKGAKYIIPEDYKYETYSHGLLPKNLTHFIRAYNVSFHNLFRSAHRLRFREWYIKEDDQIYVLGHAQKSEDLNDTILDETKKILEKIREDPSLKSHFDIDKNGKVDDNELLAAEVQISSSLLKKSMKNTISWDMSDVVISEDKHNKTFIISDRSQKEIISHLHKEFITKIVMGVIFIIAGVFFLTRHLLLA